MKQAGHTLEDDWVDPYGAIAREVYEAAQQHWPHWERFAVQTLGDAQTGQQLLMKACAAVTRVHREDPGRITNLAGYLEKTWKRMVLDEREKEKAHQQQHEVIAQTHAVADPVAQIEEHILLQELCARMDDWTREVFELRVLGYSFEEMSPALGTSGHVIRSKFHKKLQKLVRDLNDSSPS